MAEARSVGSARTLEYERVVVPLVDRLRRGLVSRFGVEVGSDVTAEVLAWSWEHIDQVASAENPAGLLFRVGQSAARRHRRWRRGHTSFPADRQWAVAYAPELDDEVIQALTRLKAAERVSVLLSHGYGFTYVEIADLLGVSEAAVTNHIHRGLTRLRRLLKDPS